MSADEYRFEFNDNPRNDGTYYSHVTFIKVFNPRAPKKKDGSANMGRAVSQFTLSRVMPGVEHPAEREFIKQGSPKKQLMDPQGYTFHWEDWPTDTEAQRRLRALEDRGYRIESVDNL